MPPVRRIRRAPLPKTAREHDAADAPRRTRTPHEQRQVTASQLEATRATLAATKDARVLAMMQSSGLVTSMDGGARSISGASRIFVNPRLWAAYRVTEKEDLVKFFSQYRNEHDRLPQVTVPTNRTGHALASYGPILGIHIE